jgi:HCOMODA/2-hydroxy-3-carboxy-muconic semialdehyde decarboxylase
MSTTSKALLRDELATGTRILGRHEMIGMFGHISLLTDDPQRYLLCPGAGTRKDRCRADDVLELHLDDEFERGRPLELYMHSEVHRLKPHIRSLIHVHSPALTALSALQEIPCDLLMLHAAFWPSRMPLFEEPELVRDRDTAQRLIGLLGDEAVALLRWHGAIIVGETVREAVLRALMAEQHAAHVLTALAHGRPLKPVPDDLSRTELTDRMLPPFTHDMSWWYEASFVPEPPGAQPPGAHLH